LFPLRDTKLLVSLQPVHYWLIALVLSGRLLQEIPTLVLSIFLMGSPGSTVNVGSQVEGFKKLGISKIEVRGFC